MFYNINFINFWIASFCTCCFGALIGPFILVISNESYLMTTFTTVLISLRFYLDMMRKTPWTFCEAAGVYWNGKTKPILEIIVNLFVSIILVKLIGIDGIFIGTIVTIILVDLTIEPYLVFRHVLKGGLAKYYGKYALYFIILTIMYAITYILCGLLPDLGIATFIGKTIIAVITTNVLIIAITFKTKEFKYTFGLVKKIIKSFLEKIKIEKKDTQKQI